MGDQPIWSVGLVIDDAESRKLSENSVALYMMEATEGHLLRFSSPPETDGGDFENLRLEVAAPSAAAAEDRALGVVYRARRAANLPDRVVPVAWVSPRGQLESGESYLDQAEELLEEENFSLAIVAAEIHLEAQAKTMIELAVKGVAPAFVEVLLQHPNNMRIYHLAGLKMMERFLGLELTQLPEWQDYRAHRSRRNEVAHSGKYFEEAEARKSIAIVRKMWLRITEAFRTVEKDFLVSDTS